MGSLAFRGMVSLVLGAVLACGGTGAGDARTLDEEGVVDLPGPVDSEGDVPQADDAGDLPGPEADDAGDLPGPEADDGGDLPGPQADAVRDRLIAVLLGTGDPLAFAALCDEVATALGDAAAGEPADARQARCLRTLTFGLDRPAGWVRTRSGTLRRARLDLEVPKAELGGDVTALDVAMRAIRALAPLLRVEGTDRAFRLVRTDTGAYRSLMFRQYARDVPVFGSWLEATVIERASTFVLRGLSGRYVPALPLPADEAPAVTPEGALAAIVAAQSLGPADLVPVAPPRLWVFDAGLFAPECPKCPVGERDPRLAWRVVYAAPQTGGVVVDAFVDAATGAVLYHVPRKDGEDLRILTASNHASNTCYASDCRVGIDPWYDEDGLCQSWTGPCWGDNHCWWGRLVWCAEPDAEGVAARDFVRATYELFRAEFPSGADLGVDHAYYAYLNACWDGHGCPLENAGSQDCLAWPDIHTFGTGWATMDVIGHEAGHTWNRHLTNYVYSDESGANSEHVSDMLGVFAACRAGIDCDWWHGEHIHGSETPVCGRHLADPGDCSDPDHVDSYVLTTSDHGGVHTNCTILDKAGWLMTEGGVHGYSGMEVRGLGLEKVKTLYRRAVPGLPEAPGFQDVAERFSFTCDSLVGVAPDEITDNDCCQVRKAYAAVGLGEPDSDCDGHPDSIEFDPDADGVDVPADNCPLIVNPDQADLDGDGEGDRCDEDVDGDGRPDDEDNCRTVANHGQGDDDHDGVGNACEDGDGDGVFDPVDNCPDVSNPDQPDLDGDGEGDTCDDDVDGDGVRDDGDGSGSAGDHRCAGGATASCDDNCRRVGNAAQADGDGDAVGDACDNCPALGSTDRGDLDGDGLGDPCDDDRDGDGVENADDDCPDEAAARTGLRICPSDTICRPGCPDRRALVPGLMARIEARDIADVAAGEGPLPVLGMALDPCAFVDCAAGEVLDAEVVLGMKVSMGLDPSLTMDAPVLVSLALVDESGRKLATAMVRLVANGVDYVPDMDVELRSLVLPSLRTRFTTGLGPPEPEAAAVPALHLLVMVLPGSPSNTALLRATPLSLKVAGGGGGDAVEALKECGRRGLGDVVALLRALWHVIDYANIPGDPTPSVLDLTVDMDGNGVPETSVKGAVTGGDLSDGMQKNEVAVITWTATTNGAPTGGGSFSFVKLSDDNTFRVTIVADTTFGMEPTCGPLLLTSLGLHGKPNLPYPSMWYGMLEFSTSVDGHSLDALVVFTDGATSASLTGTTDQGAAVQMEIDVASF